MFILIVGEDMFLTSIMGASYCKGLSKNSTWSDPDAVIPVMKVSHAAAFPSFSAKLPCFSFFSTSPPMEAQLVD
jgi:hypothetical protein